MAQKSKSAAERLKERSEKLEAQIKDQEKRRKERQFLEELAKRISIAREGRSHIERKNFPAAMNSYRRFLSITARSFDKEISELSPALFNDKNRIAESLIISSIFFDLLKLLDKLDTDSARQERRLYHQLFLKFTKGMPFQHFAAENIRKALVYSDSIVNKKEFWATYRAIVGRSFCIVATWAFDSDSAPEVVRLRRFRDEFLWPNPVGRAFSRWYHKNGAQIADLLSIFPVSRAIFRFIIRLLTRLLPSRQ